MYVMIFGEHHGNRYFLTDRTNEYVEKISKEILEDRLEQDCYYFDEDKEKAEKAVNDGRCYVFLSGRKRYDGEGFDFEELENWEDFFEEES